MTDKEYNHLIELRNKCYQDRKYRETEINYFTGFNDGYEKGRENFEKENVELKKKNLATQDAVTMQMYTNKANKEIANREITKAKELLTRFVMTSVYFNGKETDLVEEAEQFLKENK